MPQPSSSAAFCSGVGASSAADALEAGREAARAALRRSPHPCLALVFAAAELDQQCVLAGVREAIGDTPIFGTSSFGEIGPQGYKTRSVVVTLLSGAFTFAMAAEAYGGAPHRAALRVADACVEKLAGKSCDVALIFATTEEGQAGVVLRTVKEVLGESTVVFGGGSGIRDTDQISGPSYQYAGGQITQGGLGLLLVAFDSPSLRVTTSFSHGLQPISNPLSVTRAEGHFVYEVNGESVFSFYEKYLGRTVEEAGTMLRTYPFLVKCAGYERTLVRVPVFIERENGRIGFFPTESMEAQTVSLAHFARNEIVRACRESAYNTKVALAEYRPRLLLAVSCGARQMLLGNRVGEESEILFDVFGRDVPAAGLYSAAEIAPLACGESDALATPASSQVVAETFCLLAIGDSSAPARPAPIVSSGRHRAADPALAGRLAAEVLEEDVSRLVQQIKESEELLDLREQVLLKVNKENIEVTNELRAVNLALSEMNQRNLRLQRIIRQYTPRTTWNKAGKLAKEEKLEIPDESADMTYLFLDVKGFTSFSETHSPEEVVRSLNEIFQPVTDILYGHTGDVNKFIGDAIFATFDLPVDGVRAALDICQKIRELRTPFSVRIGIHMGRAVLGNVGSDLRRDNTLIGDAVNLAQRLESNATPGGITVSREVHDAVMSSLALKGRFREISVKGKSAPVEVFDVDPEASSY